MPRFVAALALAACAQFSHAQAPSLFVTDGADVRLALHTFEIPTLDRVTFELPSGPIEVDLRVVSQRGPASYSLAGTHPEMPFLHAMITVEGPAVTALITHPDLGTHRFEHTDRGAGALKPVPTPVVPLCGCASCTHDAASFAPESAHADAGAYARSTLVSSVAGGQAPPPGVATCTDGPDQIDVLVLYTQKAVDLAGGDPSLVLASVQMGIDEFNLACQNATVIGDAPGARLAHAAFTPYPETTTSSSAHLTRLRDADDGDLDEAHELRDRHAADVVILVGGAMDVCGRAYIGVLPGNTPRPDLAFGVVNYNCTNAPVYAFAHELGHILGALHNIDSDYCDTGSREFAHAFVAPDESFSTIMSSGSTAPRIPYFSDADATFMGMPVGDAAVANNAGAFRDGSAAVVAQYRLSDCNNNGICDESEIAMGVLDDLDMNGVADSCQRDEDQNGIADGVEIMLDPSLDLDADGVLDSVELPVRFVDASATGSGTGLTWSDAHTDLNEALDAAMRSGGDIAEVWVAGGTYRPTDSTTARAADFLVTSNVTLYGSFAGTETEPDQRDIGANPTILSGDLQGNDLPDGFDNHRDNTLTLMRFSRGENIVVDGFTFRGGFGDTSANCGFYNFGGGLFAFFSEYEVRNCTFERNGANNGGGLASTDGSIARIVGSDFLENTGVPVPFRTGTGEIIESEGSGAGVYMISAPAPENDAWFQNCRFIGNEKGAALSNLGGSPTIVGSLFAQNRYRLAAISNSSTGGSDATFINCTVVNNIGEGFSSYAGIRNSRSDVTLINTVVWGNTGTSGGTISTQVANDAGSTTTARNSIIQFVDNANASFTLTDVIGGDPLFTDPNAGDFTLDAASPAIDAGDTSALDGLGVLTDLASGDRIVDDPSVLDTGLASLTDPLRPIVDIGAFERQGVITNGCSGDFDNDGDVDLGDFGFFGAAFGSVEGDPTYAIEADIDGDGDVDLGDFGGFGADFGRTDC